MDSNVNDTLGTDDCDVVDLTMSEVPIDSPEVAASLPPPDQFVRGGSSRSFAPDAPKKDRRLLWFAISGIALLAIILGLSIGLTTNVTASGSQSAGDSTKAEPRKATRDAAIKYFVNNNVSSSGELRNPASPQAKAVAWLTEADGRNLPVPGHSISTTVGYHYLARYVLAVLFFALNGENWTLNPTWLSADDFCRWNVVLRVKSSSGNDVVDVPFGAYCDDVSQKIIAIHLDRNSLKGAIPKELGRLTSVRQLSMSGNELKGSFPSQVCSFPDLSVLILSGNEFIGEVPTCVSNLKSMQVLFLSKNEFSGNLPDLSGMRDIAWLGLDNNTRLTGDVTRALNNMTKLRLLYLDDTGLSGRIDKTFLQGSVNVSEVDLSRCSFRGSIPTHLFELTSLKVLDLSGNSLHGSFPSISTSASSLEYLALNGNVLNGTLPETISNLTSLIHLDLSRNQFSGNIPIALSSVTTLQRLYLSENGFKAGPVPSGFQDLTSLRELSLKNTSRTGSIPTFLGQLEKLLLLDFDDNKLNGTIPSQVGDLSDLQFLLLNRNEDLGGALPESFGQLSSLRMILLDRTDLNGSLDVLCGLPAFDNTSSSANRSNIISADCEVASEIQAEVVCKCCKVCCTDSDPTGCQDFDEVTSLELEWQYGYDRVDFNFGGFAFFEDLPNSNQSP